MNSNAADNDTDTEVTAAPGKPDPLAAFISGGAFSSGTATVSARPIAASGANGGGSASASAPTIAKPDPLAAFIRGGAFSSGAAKVSTSAAAAAAATSVARLAPVAAAATAPDPFGNNDDGGRFCAPVVVDVLVQAEHVFDLACLCCAPEGDMEMSNPALAKMMGIKGKLGGGGRGQFDF